MRVYIDAHRGSHGVEPIGVMAPGIFSRHGPLETSNSRVRTGIKIACFTFFCKLGSECFGVGFEAAIALAVEDDPVSAMTQAVKGCGTDHLVTRKRLTPLREAAI
jgi:hypothetical protein